MASKRKRIPPAPRAQQKSGSTRPAKEVGVRQSRDGAGWELVHPRCACERQDDLEEVQRMIEGGAPDVAQEELRWLLEGCSDFIEAHYLLGVLAVDESNDLELARAHFGYAYQLGLTALRRAGSPRPVRYSAAANQQFFEAGKGLAYCLRELGKLEMAAEVLDELIGLDPDAPLGLPEMRAKLIAPSEPTIPTGGDENNPLRIIEM